MKLKAIVLGVVCATLAACGAVTVPEEFTYRLSSPQPDAPGGLVAGVLRVGDVDVVAELSGDRLVVADDGIRMRSWHHHRWAGPIDRLVGDAVVTGLVRSRRFLDVKSPSASGIEDLQLNVRVLDFHQVASPQGWRARATVELRLAHSDGRLAFQDEFRADTPLPDGQPATLAQGLGTSIATVVDGFLERCDRVGLFLHAAPTR
ncbi:MAG: ABC-type transport auxiliary lipoprotein family protein [Planctomycetota bacterium]